MKILFFIFLFPVFCAHGQSSFDAKIAEASGQLKCDAPDERNPVSLNAVLVTEKDSIAVIVKAVMAPGWHIYAYVPSTLPYIQMDPVLKLPATVKKAGDWMKTRPTASANDRGVLIYENEAVLVQKAVKAPGTPAGGIINTGLYYQTCNLRQCLPPLEKTFDLRY